MRKFLPLAISMIVLISASISGQPEDIPNGGFENGEDETVLYGTLSFTFDPGDTSAPGEYDIIPGGLTSGNYDISFVNGTLTGYVRLTLLVSPEGAGTVDGAGESYSEGDEVAISASANTGYEFVNWTGDTEYIANVDAASTTVTMPGSNVSLTANFKIFVIY